ncbi:hypothetical protein [Amycolatopsis sp. cmx-8-4]|uniref:hypothetical protein n=1 Tax=Amycolatopsis sp. cmx-8-4 TaxID=2790947 RepID=UPI00397ADD07
MSRYTPVSFEVIFDARSWTTTAAVRAAMMVMMAFGSTKSALVFGVDQTPPL